MLRTNLSLEALVDTDLDTLATAPYATCDDVLKSHPERVPARPVVGLQPVITDAELLTLAVMQALLGYTSEARVAALCPGDPAGYVPDPASAVGVQQAATEVGGRDVVADRGPGRADAHRW